MTFNAVRADTMTSEGFILKGRAIDQGRMYPKNKGKEVDVFYGTVHGMSWSGPGWDMGIEPQKFKTYKEAAEVANAFNRNPGFGWNWKGVDASIEVKRRTTKIVTEVFDFDA